VAWYFVKYWDHFIFTCLISFIKIGAVTKQVHEAYRPILKWYFKSLAWVTWRSCTTNKPFYCVIPAETEALIDAVNR